MPQATCMLTAMGWSSVDWAGTQLMQCGRFSRRSVIYLMWGKFTRGGGGVSYCALYRKEVLKKIRC